MTEQVTATELARILGVSKPRVTQLEHDGVLTPLPNGRYWLAASVKAVIKNIRERQAGAKVGVARAALLAEQQRRLELQNAERTGRLVSLDEVDASIMEALALLRMELSSLGGRLAGPLANETDPAKCKQLVNDETDRALNAVAAALESWAVGKLAKARHA